MNREVARREGVAESNGIELWYETFGHPSDPAVLLIMGAGMPAQYWPDEFCDVLARAGRFVIRFDNRDAGRSTWINHAASTVRDLFRSPAYTLRDMANDTTGLLDALSIERAHLVGASLGAAIAELVTVGDPARVISLTLMGHSRPASPEEIEAAESQISDEPEPEPDLTPERWMDLLTDAARAAAGPAYAFDEGRARALWSDALEHGWSPAGALRQRAAFYFSERASAEAVAETRIPVLALQGTADAEFEWAKDFSRRLPNARFVALEGMGHEFPPAASEIIAAHVLAHTSVASC